ncbi:MAG: hypothetical protein JEZ03_10295 [Bacteroidales bacterium]|nr:hypothetical protein [Bacteroidales bacterium]
MPTDRLSQTEIFNSPAILYEDNKILGPANTLHADINSIGEGRFSFWKGILYFSSSDNSNPRINNRQYILKIPNIPISRKFTIIFIFAIGLTIIGVFELSNKYPGIKRTLLFLGILINLFLFVGACYQFDHTILNKGYSKVRTWIYIRTFNPARYERLGTDYCNPRFDPERIGKEREEIDANLDYDFDRLQKTRNYLWGIDRPIALKYIFDVITQDAETNIEKHLALLEFLQKADFHNANFHPIDPSGTLVYDPLVYLELGEMWCGDVAHLAIDLYLAAVYEARMVQLSNHQIAEIYYDGDWHYFDADLYSGGDVVIFSDGSIPSVNELSQPGTYYQLDSMPIYPEANIINSCYDHGGGSGVYGASYAYFSSLSYEESGAKSVYYVKTASLEEAKQDILHYGWFNYEIIPDTERLLTPFEIKYVPSLPYIDDVIVDGKSGKIQISFHSLDQDNDLNGYHIYISESSRAWNYAMFYGNDDIKEYWSNSKGWQPEMYDAYFKLPPSDIALLSVEYGEVEIKIPPNSTYYISIMAFDSYGEQVGRELYSVSNELEINIGN